MNRKYSKLANAIAERLFLMPGYRRASLLIQVGSDSENKRTFTGSGVSVAIVRRFLSKLNHLPNPSEIH
jgi:hypothetical protein